MTTFKVKHHVTTLILISKIVRNDIKMRNILPGSVAEMIAPKKKQSLTVNSNVRNLVITNIRPLKQEVEFKLKIIVRIL